MDKREIDREISRLVRLRDALNIKTADGHPIVVGETYYEIDPWHDIEEIIPTEDSMFTSEGIKVLGLNDYEVYYNTIWKDVELGKAAAIARAEAEVTRAEAVLKGAQNKLEIVKTKLLTNTEKPVE